MWPNIPRSNHTFSLPDLAPHPLILPVVTSTAEPANHVNMRSTLSSGGASTTLSSRGVLSGRPVLTFVCVIPPMTLTLVLSVVTSSNVDCSVALVTHNAFEDPFIHIVSRLENKVVSFLTSAVVLRRPVPSQRRT